jgi:hypothetical protein
MTVDRSLWNNMIASFPAWVCPSCQRGHVRQSPDSQIVKAETGASKKAQKEEENWTPEWVIKRFVTLLKCDDASCEEIIAVSGTCHTREVDWNYDSSETTFIDLFEIQATVPAPLPFIISESVPAQIVEQLKAAASHMWSDPEAAANKIRQAVEVLLTEQKIARYTKDKRGKRRTITLHDRIKLYQKKQPNVADHLLAVKWIGNAGSHTGNLDLAMLFDGLDILEVVLDDIYQKTRAKINKKVRLINKSKGKAIRSSHSRISRKKSLF